MQTKLSALLTATLLATLLSFPAADSDRDWPAWSGPHRDLTSSGDGVFEGPSFGLEQLWRKPLGSGYSGIVAAGELLVTAFSDGTSDLVAALDAATGEERWRYRIGDTYKGHDGSDDGPLSTPTLHQGRVYAFGPRGRLFALRLADGEEVWSRQLVEELGARPDLYGFATTPAVAGGVLVVEVGGSGGRAVAGFDPASGETLWSAGDDAVSYQSPMALAVGGEEQVVAVTGHYLLGLRPASGEILWRHRHSTGEDGGFERVHPVPVGDGGVLLVGFADSVLYRVGKTAGGYGVDEVWRSRAMYRTFASPVPYQGYLYGYAGMRFLTCVDAATGKTVWKSRRPGEGVLVRVDDQLVIMARNGEVVVAEATPEGYREKARVQALGEGSHLPLTRPSFAAGRVYVRDLREIAGVGVTAAAPAVVADAGADEHAVEPRGEIAELARRVEAAEDKAAVIDQFLAAHPEAPILEGEDLVHFVFRGAVDDLMLAGNMEPWERERPMHRIAGTDFYFRSLTLEPGGRFEYVFKVFDETRLDPRNPRRGAVAGRERSVLTTRGWSETDDLRQPAGVRGRIEKLTWKSALVGDEREVAVYLPAGYDASDRRYPLLMIYHGDAALEWGHADRVLDNLVGKSVAPVIVAFVPQGHFSEAGSRAPELIQGLAEELLPRLDRDYRTLARPEDRALMGNSHAGWFAFRVVIERPDLFRKAATQSPVYGDDNRDRIAELITQSAKADLGFVVEWTAHEYRDQEGRTAGELLAEVLRQKGYEPLAAEVPGGAGWGTWRQRFGRVLEALFAKEGS